MDKRFWAVIGIIVLVFGGMVFASSQKKDTVVTGTTSHYAGNLKSTVTLTEYGDYQCPACSKFYPVAKEVKAKYADKVRFQFRNLPLTSLHPNAFAGARAAEAADLQGKFWEMHDLLYENQDPYGRTGWVADKDPLTNYFVKYATQLKLNTTQFKKDFASTAVNNRINADLDAFKATGEQMSTPSYFINGKLVSSSKLVDGNGAPSLDSFSKVLEDALAGK